MRLPALFMALLLVLVAMPALAQEKRVALVIGNGAYQHATELTNPANDAADISAKLESIGFTVITGIDQTRVGMEDLIRRYATEIADARIALFFYAGHGMQVNGRNYLIPVDAQLADATALAFETIDADEVFGYMGGKDRIALAFLDACRDNPLARSFARSQPASRSANVGLGLAPPETVGTGLFIGFATAPGDVASDGRGRNSPFSAALLTHLDQPGVEIQQLMTRVKADVRVATDDAQRPWHNSDLSTEVYLVPASMPASAAPASDDSAEFEAFAWSLVRSGRDPEALRLFLGRYPQSANRDEAVRLLAAYADDPAPAAPTEAPPYDRLAIRFIQFELNRIGCDAGAEDGRWGQKTTDALAELAERTGIRLDVADPAEDLLAVLGRVNPGICDLAEVTAETKVYRAGLCATLFDDYRAARGPKAWATSVDHNFCGYASVAASLEQARQFAISNCRSASGQNCVVRLEGRT